MSSQPPTDNMHGDSSLSELIEMMKTTRDAFKIQEDIDVLSSINENVQQLKSKTSSSLQDKTKQLELLRGEVDRTTDKIESLSQYLMQSKSEAKAYANKDQLFKQYSVELDSAERKQDELREKIDTITDELATLQTNEKDIKIKNKTNPFNSDDINLERSISDTKNDVDTLFDDIVVDEEDEQNDSDYSDDEKDPDYYKLEIFKSMDIVVDPDSKEVFISRKDGKVDVLSLEESGHEYFNNKFVWERLNMK
ncbi:kinetochore protein Spc24p [Monosporozyma servazzii]